jgi:hypothetical protein
MLAKVHARGAALRRAAGEAAMPTRAFLRCRIFGRKTGFLCKDKLFLKML